MLDLCVQVVPADPSTPSVSALLAAPAADLVGSVEVCFVCKAAATQ